MSKKYHYTVTQESDASWKASIIRQVSSRKSNVSKSQSDFATEAEAKTWAESEIETFRQAQAQRNNRKNEQRKKNQGQREQRSNRRAAKTAAAKTKGTDSEAASSADVWEKTATESKTIETEPAPSNETQQTTS